MCNNTLPDNVKPIFMQSEKVSKQVFTFNLENYKDAGRRLAAVSIQGLVNRKTPELFLLNENISWCLEYYLKKNFIESITEIANIEKLFEFLRENKLKITLCVFKISISPT